MVATSEGPYTQTDAFITRITQTVRLTCNNKKKRLFKIFRLHMFSCIVISAVITTFQILEVQLWTHKMSHITRFTGILGQQYSSVSLSLSLSLSASQLVLKIQNPKTPDSVAIVTRDDMAVLAATISLLPYRIYC